VQEGLFEHPIEACRIKLLASLGGRQIDPSYLNIFLEIPTLTLAIIILLVIKGLFATGK
jgi:hypothetical protein